MHEITWGDFEQVELRVGTILAVSDFPEARKPAYKLTIDFGETIGIKKSSAQITKLYTHDDLIGTQVVCVLLISLQSKLARLSQNVLRLDVPMLMATLY